MNCIRAPARLVCTACMLHIGFRICLCPVADVLGSCSTSSWARSQWSCFKKVPPLSSRHAPPENLSSCCLVGCLRPSPLQEMRKGKYIRSASADRDVLHTIAELHLPVESCATSSGVTLLPPSTVEQLLIDKRKTELVQPFKLALLKLSSQVGWCQ
jgi:hypothetical protein